MTRSSPGYQDGSNGKYVVPTARAALSAEVAHVQTLQLGLGRVLEKRGAVLTLALLHPVPVDAERATIYYLKKSYIYGLMNELSFLIILKYHNPIF